MKYTILAGRILFSILFIFSGLGHFSDASIGYAAAMGVPAANILVPVTGIMELAGGLSILIGYKAKWGAWVLVAFLLPVTFVMHAFWNKTDPMQMQMEMINFMKNLCMLGGALIITYFGSGPFSLENTFVGNANRKVALN